MHINNKDILFNKVLDKINLLEVPFDCPTSLSPLDSRSILISEDFVFPFPQATGEFDF